MKIISIEPTPSPNSMKITMDHKLPNGIRKTYKSDNKNEAPIELQPLLDIPHVTSFYHASDFIALDRQPKGNWQQILTQVRELFGDEKSEAKLFNQQAPDAISGIQSTVTPDWGEVFVKIQEFRGIPIQIRVTVGLEEQRIALPERFAKAVMEAGMASPNLLRERKLVDQGVRYGEPQELLQVIVSELEAVYDDEKLASLVSQSLQLTQTTEDSSPNLNEQLHLPLQATIKSQSLEQLTISFQDEDWHKRYAALLQVRPDEKVIPLLVKALSDPQASIRRIAAVYLGDTKGPLVLPHLFKALKDTSSAVRRTVGDVLSDLGDPTAIEPMIEALQDTNKLVRWRAARFLYEVGDQSAVPALEVAMDDPEFEVRMQVQIALERIKGGEAASGTIWQQMTQSNQ